MTDHQRITLMADWWPKACTAQGWNKSDRARRMAALSEAVGRTITSANQLNTTTDVDKVKAHLGMLADDLKSTIETDNEELGEGRRLRKVIRDQLKCLELYLQPDSALRTPHSALAEKYLAELIRDKFKHASRANPLTLEDLDADVIQITRNGVRREIPSQLNQIVMTLQRNLQTKRKAADDTIHDMKTRAAVYCNCAQCRRLAPAPQPEPVESNCPW